MQYYTQKDCDKILYKLANLGMQQPQGQPEQMGQGGGQPLGTIGAEMNGGVGQSQGAGGPGSEGFKVNKDQLYERLIQEKDNLTRLKVQLASSGQLPMDMMEQQPQQAPLEQMMQQGMGQDMLYQQQMMQQPQGLQVQASFKKKS